MELVTPAARAAEVIPAFYCVSSRKNGYVGLASINTGKRPIGIVNVDCQPGEAVDIIVNGIVYNDNWSWSAELGQELYCNEHGEIVQFITPDSQNVRVGVALSSKTALINIDFYGSLTRS